MGVIKSVDARVEDLDSVLKEELSASEKPPQADHRKLLLLLLFLADVDPSTNRSWCPDCVRAEPVIYRKLEEFEGDVYLVRAFVGDRTTWRNPAHPWRIDQRFKLKGVPTLIRLSNSSTATDAAGRLEDHEAHIDKRIDDLLR